MIREMESYDTEERENTSFRKEIEPMTRAEWVKQARAECEKELEFYEQLQQRARELWEEEHPEDRISQEEESEDDFQAHCRYVELSSEPEEMKEEEEQYEERVTEDKEEELEKWENQKIYSPSFQWSYLSKFTVRLMTAVVIALFVITIDHFGLKANSFDSEVVKTAIQKNDTIESVEETVTTFARDKVMPIFSKSK